MDPVVSVVNLEDEFPSSTEIRTRGQLDESLLNPGPAGGEFESTNLASGQSSGVCSSPPEPAIPSTTGDGNVQTPSASHEGEDQLILDVIHQLERQCSTSNEEILMANSREVSIEVGDAADEMPLASTLFANPDRLTSASPAAVVFEKGISPMYGENMEKPRATSVGFSNSAYSMWIASAKTRETLALLPPGSDGRICYTMPGIMIEESLVSSDFSCSVRIVGFG